MNSLQEGGGRSRLGEVHAIPLEVRFSELPDFLVSGSCLLTPILLILRQGWYLLLQQLGRVSA